jgi:hypothetical protein
MSGKTASSASPTPNDAALGRRRKSETAPRPLNATIRNVLPPPAAGWRQRDMFFYEPINLAKMLTAVVHATPS